MQVFKDLNMACFGRQMINQSGFIRKCVHGVSHLHMIPPAGIEGLPDERYGFELTVGSVSFYFYLLYVNPLS